MFKVEFGFTYAFCPALDLLAATRTRTSLLANWITLAAISDDTETLSMAAVER